MRINTNIMAINTHRNLGVNSVAQARATEKLSSGLRINRAADDAAGLGISEKMRAQIRGLSMASKNAQDGISLIQAAEGALQETHSILQRMRELSVQAATDTNENLDRKSIQDEINQLSQEIDRIAYTTEFNRKTLLDGTLANGTTYGKVTTGTNISNVTVGVNATDAIYSVGISTAGVKGSWDLNYSAITKVSVGGDYKISNGTISANVSVDVGDTGATIAARVAETLNRNKDFSAEFSAIADGGVVKITSLYTGVQTAWTSVDGNTTPTTIGAYAPGTAVNGTDAKISIDGTAKALTLAEQKSGIVTIAGSGATLVQVKFNDTSKLSSSIVEVGHGKQLTLQVGANTGGTQTIKVGIDSLNATSLGVANLDMSSHETAQAAIANIQKAIEKVSDQRGLLGAVQNRLEHTVANLDTVNENLTAAESRIRDTDMAKEMMNFTRTNILQQAATAMLAQANQVPQTVLQLLR